MNYDDILQKLGKVSKILQEIKDAIARRLVSKNRGKSDVFRDAATNYALENASSVVNGAMTREFFGSPLHSRKMRNDYQPENMVVPPVEHTVEISEEPINRQSDKEFAKKRATQRYPISDRVEKIIKSMPRLKRDPDRDSLASIQNPLSPDGYPPVKALVGVFTWTHDRSLAKKILELLNTEEERAGLLSEAVRYYKLHHDDEDASFFNEWIWRDLLALVYDGTISLETASKLKDQANRADSNVPVFVMSGQSRQM